MSDVERAGVPPTDRGGNAAGCRRSTTKRGEEHGKEGRTREGTKGVSQRPYGTTDPEKAGGVDPQAPVDEDSPNLQGG